MPKQPEAPKHPTLEDVCVQAFITYWEGTAAEVMKFLKDRNWMGNDPLGPWKLKGGKEMQVREALAVECRMLSKRIING